MQKRHKDLMRTLVSELRHILVGSIAANGSVLRGDLDRELERLGIAPDGTIAPLDALAHYAWPGNVRELENAIERAVAMSGEGAKVVREEHLPESVTGAGAAPADSGVQIPDEGVDFEKQVAQIEQRYLEEALRLAAGVRTRAAELLRMSYRSFRHYAKKHNL